MLTINRGQVSEAYARLLGIKGPSPLSADQGIIPVVNVAQLEESPFATYAIPCSGVTTPAAVAAENGYAWVSPNLSLALEVLRVIVNVPGAAMQFSIRWLTQAQQVTVGVGSFAQLISLRPQDPHQYVESRASVIDQGTHAGLVGTQLAVFKCLAGGDREFEFPPAARPVLFGADLTGQIPALAVIGDTVNQSFNATFICREWVLPG